MKILIAYDSKTGTAKECAELLARHFSQHTLALVDLREGRPAILDYDFVILGGYVRMGKFSKNMSSFIKDEKDSLMKIGHAFFICCCIPDEAEGYICKNISKELRDSAVIADNFGGELRPERHRGIEKLFVKLARKYMQTNDDVNCPNEFKTLPAILPDSISHFADKIKESFAEK